MSEGENTDKYHAEIDGVIDTVEVTLRVEGDNEHLADLIISDLESRAEEINQIVELRRHPEATNPPKEIDWEGWLRGEYDHISRQRNGGADNDQ